MGLGAFSLSYFPAATVILSAMTPMLKYKLVLPK